MKKILLVMLVTLSLLLVSCNVELTAEEEAEVKEELETLSDEELVDLATGDDSNDAIAGQGYTFARYSRRSVRDVAARVVKDRLDSPQQALNIDAERMRNTPTTQGPDVKGQIDTTGGTLGEGKVNAPCTCEVKSLLDGHVGMYASKHIVPCGQTVTLYQLMDCRDPNYPDEESIGVKKSFVYECDGGKLEKSSEKVENVCSGDHYEVPIGQ